ncbi:MULTISPECIES: YlmC/YmxH family sporulation protein [Thermincola]|uniref:YlmC/YmxH family sporulation protein n=1 Tax=Thermincola TaxID=278993 RepID=UPI0002FEA893|nr:MULTISPECIES: YlmC/YmxH family sporulation protein [Thermincola]
MRLSDLEGKEIININDGSRLGVIGEADLIIDPRTGLIQSIILPQKNNLISFWVDKQNIIIPWEAVRKIGQEVIIVDLDSTVPNLSSYLG